jgi:hypothetical protein
MKKWRFLLPLACVCASVASAQVTPIGPFTGADSESFETQSGTVFTPCVLGRVFNNKADLCTPGYSGCLIASSWAFFCTIHPQSGGRFFGSAGGFAEYTFDTPAQRFGGYFGTNFNISNATARFYDAGGNLLDTLIVTVPADCTWTWNGWDAGSGPKIKRVQIIGMEYFEGRVDMDSLELDSGPGSGCAAPFVYCTGKSTSRGCVPIIGFTGVSSASAYSGFKVFGVLMRNNSLGFLFYGVSGQATTPFQGGIQCVRTPIKRTRAISSGGHAFPAGDCSGQFSIDMNAFAHWPGPPQPLPALLVPGTVVDCQWWGRDAGFPPPDNSMLSNGLEYTVCP